MGHGATLAGNSRYALNSAGVFTSAGTLAPLFAGEFISIGGDYVQSGTGRLLSTLQSDGRFSRLSVTGNATLDGTLAIAPQRGWYASGFSVTPDQWLNVTRPTGAFAAVTTTLASPTLTASAGALVRQRQITELVLAAAGTGRAAAREAGGGEASDRMPSGSWRPFAMPFGSGYWRTQRGDAVGASGNSYGVVWGAQRVSGDDRAWSVGAHAAISGQSARLDSRTPGAGRGTAFDLGGHARYAPDLRRGPHAFALARVGVEDARLDRTIAVNGYTATPRGTWTGGTAPATLGGGWRGSLASAVSAGPVAALDYTLVYRPSLSETQANGVNLALAGNAFHSLRLRAAGEVREALPLAAGNTLVAHLQATWNHELMGGTLAQSASFAGAPSTRFTTCSDVLGRDSLGVQVELSCRVGQRLALGAALTGTLYPAGNADIAGSVSVAWKF